MDDGSWSLSAAEAARTKQRPEAFGTRGMVASAHPVAAAIGVNILARGGDAFVLAHDARMNETIAYNGSGVAAAGASADYYRSRGYTDMPIDGVHAVSVPGAVSVYEAIHKRHCTMPWPDLFQPAIELAANGLAITEYIANRYAEMADKLARHRYSAQQYLPQGRAPRAGERWAAPDLAKTLRVVAKGGADAFYRGEIAEKMLAFLKAEGALFQADDFARQQAVIYAPISTDYRGTTVYETAPPSQGFLVLEQLNILEAYDLAALKPFSAERMHLMIEAKKLAFADRNRHAGDPAFVRWPLERLISKAHAERRRALIDLSRAQWPDGAVLPEHSGDTSYFAVADGNGNALSFIHSLSNSFGSTVVAGETGVTLNNRAGRGFSIDPSHPNVIAPGKRTMHTLNAYLLFRDGKPWLIGGTPGGDQQAQWNPQIITGLIDHGMGLQELADAPRWYSFPGTDPANLGKPTVVKVDARISETARTGLTKLGHNVETIGAWAGGGAVQLIQFDHGNGVLRAGSDSRPGGMALGL
jgi:gamma-glutamyltranspeptidase/glutathione hydrolase